MVVRNVQNVIGGCGLMAIGSFAAGYAIMTLPLGSLALAGPGLFPAALGGILFAIGVALLALGLSQPGERMEPFDLRSFVLILSSILAFALLLQPLGMVPAVVVLTFLASRADSKLSMKATAILGLVLSVGSYLVFRVGLGLPVSAVAFLP